MQPTSQEEVLPMQVPSPGLAAEAVQFFWQVTKCGAGLGLAVPCKVSSLCATQTRGIGNPFCTLNSLTINCTTAWFEIPLFDTYWGKTPSHSIDKSSQSLALLQPYQELLTASGDSSRYSLHSLPHNRALILSVKPALTQSPAPCLPPLLN